MHCEVLFELHFIKNNCFFNLDCFILRNTLYKAFLPITDQPQEESTNRTANVQRKTTDNLSDVASDGYEEVIEPDYMEPRPFVIAGN